MTSDGYVTRRDGDDTRRAPDLRPLRRYLAGAVLTRMADEGARVALVLLALDRTGSAGAGGALVAALLVPHVVAAPAVGLLTDRARSPRLVLAAAAVGFATALAAVAFSLGRVPLALVLVVLLAGGTCGPALTGGLTSQLAALVPERSLPRAFGLDSLSYNVSGIAGPAVAGLCATLVGTGVATVALAMSAARAAACWRRCRSHAGASAPRGHRCGRARSCWRATASSAR